MCDRHGECLHSGMGANTHRSQIENRKGSRHDSHDSIGSLWISPVNSNVISIIHGNCVWLIACWMKFYIILQALYYMSSILFTRFSFCPLFARWSVFAIFWRKESASWYCGYEDILHLDKSLNQGLSGFSMIQGNTRPEITSETRFFVYSRKG